MMKHIRMLSAFAFFFSFTSAYAQELTCSLSDSQSGDDDENVTATVDDFSCIDTVTNAFVTSMTIDASIGFYCDNWYDFSLEVNGVSVGTGLCDGTFDIADYVEDINAVTSISVVSNDLDNYGDGVTVDLDVDITYLITDCPPPSELDVTSITSSTALFSWTPNGSEILWDVELVDITAGNTATGTPTTYGVITDSLALSGLTPDNMYEIYVRANCVTGTDVESVWVGPFAFTTEPTCYPVADVAIADITDVAANASWTSTEDEWEIELIDVTAGGTFSGTPNTLGLTAASYSFSSLTPENTYSFKVRSNCGPLDGNSAWSTAVTFTTDPSCLAPSDLVVSNVTNSEVTISWVSNDDETQWGIEIINVDNGDAQDFTVDYTSTDTTYTITGLSGITTYEIFVNAICSSTDSSAWVSSGEFTTLCDVYTPDYAEDFSTFLDPCWSESEGPITGPDLTDETSSWTSDDFLNSGNGSAKINLFTTSADEWLISPLFDLTAGGYELNFDVGMTDWGNSGTSDMGSDDTVRVMQSLDGGATWTTIYTWALANQPTNAGENLSIDISTLTTSNAQFAFYATDGTINDPEDYDFFIDNFKVRTIPTCFEVSSLQSSNVLANSAVVDWSAGADETSWQIEYGLEGFTQGSGTFIIVSDSSHTLTGLTAESDYEVYVRSVCSPGDSSAWTGPITFTTLCEAFVPDYIEDFATYLDPCWTESEGPITGPDYNDVTSAWTSDNFANISGSSSCAKINLYTTGNDAWLVTPLFDLSAGGYEINLDVAVTAWGNTNTSDMGSDDTVRIMQSFDGGTTWSEIYNWNASNVPSNTGDNISIDVSTITGTAIRYAIYASDGSVNDPEDYDFFIENFQVRTIPTCPVFTDLEVSNVLHSTADLSWDPYGLEGSWEIEYGEIGFTQGSGTSIITTDSNYTLTGLDEETPYQVYVRGICGVADSSFWVGPIAFTTLIQHDIAVSGFVSPVSQGCMLTTSEEVVITISNNGGADATGFDVSYSFDGVNYTSDGIFAGVLAGNSDTTYTLNTTFDFSTADDTNLFVAVDLVADTTYITNDTNSYFISNLGDQVMQLHIATNDFGGEIGWNIIDTLSGTTIASHAPYGGYVSDADYYEEFCVYLGNTYSMEAIDGYGDGWNGGVYEITQCGGVLVANNGGLSPTTAPNISSNQVEAQEYFTVEECDDYDLGIIMMDSIYSSCNMTATEQGYLLVQNYGLMDITPGMNVEVEYQINGSGWANLATISDLASGADSLLALPTVDMTTPLTYTFEFQIIYALDENSSNDSLELDIESVDTYDEVTQDFDDAPSGWTAHIATGTTSSWEWGVPTTPVISVDVDGSAWVTRLDDNMFLNEESYLLSPCFDFSGYTNDVEFEFDFIWTSPSTTNSVRFQVSTDGGATWPTFTNANNILMPVNTTEWTQYIGLLDLAGESDVKFRFFMDNSFSTDAEGFGMDNFVVFEHVPYTDTTLADLTVDGVTVPGFDPAVFTYTYELPYGTTTVPTVDAVVNAPFYESLDITQAPAIPGTATVVITAEDTNFTATYTVEFTEAPASTNAYLSDILMDGSPFAGFDSLVFAYTATFPYGTTPADIQIFDGILSDPNATVDVTYPATVPGSVVFLVTAEDGVTTNTYTINIELEPADTVSTLSNLTVDGVTVPGFDPDTLEYTVVVSGSVVVDYTTTSPLATATASPAGPYTAPMTVTITVTAQDGSSTDYLINLIEPLSDNAYLSDLSYDDGGTYVTVPGFDSLTYTYTVELPYGDTIPNVDYLTSDAGANVDVVSSGNTLPGTTTITVTAADGTVLTYTINWTEALPDTENRLLDVTFTQLGVEVGNLSLNGSFPNTSAFNPDSNTYVFYVTTAIEAASIPDINPTLMDPTTSEILQPITVPVQWGDPYKVDVQAQDGSINTYIFNTVNSVGQEELEAGSVSMYPNPSTGLVNVEVVEDITDFTIEVISTTGQRVFVSEYTNDNAQVTLDLSSVADGMYYVILKDSQSGKSAKEKISIIK